MDDQFEFLNFPVFKSPLPEHAPMSMDAFDAFNVDDMQDTFDAFNVDDMQDTFDREVYEAEKIQRAVNVMFRIVD